MQRMIVLDRLDQYVCDIDPSLVTSATYVEEINGENSLKLVTSQRIEKTNRVLTMDAMGAWREYVVTGIDELHDSTEYYCVWSVQYDLEATFINGPYDCGIVPGHPSIPQTVHTALGVALSGTGRWQVGDVTVTTMAAASFYRRSGWDGMKTVLERWGGEMRQDIGVSASLAQPGSKVDVTRKLSLLEHVGVTPPTRRFDYGADLTGIKRTTDDGVWACRIIPLGKSQETEAGGYTRRPDISSVNDGVMWLQDEDAAAATRVISPDGSWEYPARIVVNDTYEQPDDLKAWALEHISDYTRPNVHYEASVRQFERAGMDAHGVALGDDVVVVDREFVGVDGGLRISARVTRVEGSLTDPSDVKMTIGTDDGGMTGQLSSTESSVSALSDRVSRSDDWKATKTYVSNLISRLNQSINATGGYSYITEGEGFVTYDKPVSDPTVGAEATKVVEIRGGNIRIADSRTAGGDWEWKTVIQSGHIAADLVTAASITAGFIGNASGGSYWNLDAGTMRIGAGSYIMDTPVEDVIGESQYMEFDPATGLTVGDKTKTTKTVMSSTGFECIDREGKNYVHLGRGVANKDGEPFFIFGEDAYNYRDASEEEQRYIGPNMFIVGSENLCDLGRDSFVFGKSNKITGEYVTNRTIVIGEGNSIDGTNNSIVVGSNNDILFEAFETSASNSIVVGTGNESHAFNSIVVGDGCYAGGESSACIGKEVANDHSYSFCFGEGLVSNGDHSLVIGKFNNQDRDYVFQIGNGSTVRRGSCFHIDVHGDCYAHDYIKYSDERLKDHIGHLDDDAIGFVRNLRPVLFDWKDGSGRGVGFYAQDVSESTPDRWEDCLVRDSDGNLSLSYSSIIAPLVAYCQRLEERVDELEERLEERFDKLEGAAN